MAPPSRAAARDRRALPCRSDGLLPPDYYAMAEKVTRPFGPDVLTLQTNGNGAAKSGGGKGPTSIALQIGRIAATRLLRHGRTSDAPLRSRCFDAANQRQWRRQVGRRQGTDEHCLADRTDCCHPIITPWPNK